MLSHTVTILGIAGMVVILSIAIFILQLFKIRASKKQKSYFRILSMQLLAVTVWVAMISNIFIPSQRLEGNEEYGLMFFAVAIVVGIFLIRSMIREIVIENSIEDLINKLQDHNVNLKKLDEQKNEFISIASHQLRTPLSAIIGYTSMILEGDYGDIPEELIDPINKIYKSSNSLGFLVNDFLSINRIEKGEMEYIIEDVDMDLEIKPIIYGFQHAAEEKGLNFINTCKENAVIRADVNKFKQVISNVLDNAVKYTPTGSIEYYCEKKKDYLLITVKDTGIGINEYMKEKIFNKFIRDDEAIKVDVEGNGIGLYIASVMIKAMGGDIWAESEGLGGGSTFYIKIPLVTSK